MKTILLIGLGRFGRHCARKLNELGHQVMAVDVREDRVDTVLPYVTDGLIGNSTRADFMKTLGVRNYDVCIVAIGDDFQNSLETTSLLKELGAKHVISRASRDVHEKFLLKNGADEVVYPEKNMAEWTAIRHSSNTIKDYIPVPGDYSIFEVDVPKSWIGKSMIDLKIRQKMRLNILSVSSGSGVNLDYDPALPFEEGQTIMVLGSDNDLRKHLGLAY